MKRTKIIVALLLGMVIITGLSAGGKQSASSKAATAGGKTRIQFWHSESTERRLYLEKMVDRYNVLPNGKAFVDIQYLPSNELLKRYTLGVVSNELCEIAYIDNPDTASFAAMGMLIDITARAATLPNPTYLEGPFNSGKLNGKQYALPTNSSCLALWSNDAMLKAAGVSSLPTTWDELLAVCAALKKANPNVYPLSFSAIKTEEGTFQFLPWLLSTGVNWDKMDSPEAIKALTYYKTLADNKYISPEVINWTQSDAEKQFAAGNAAMMINGSWQIANLATDAPSMKYTVSNIPRDKVYASSLGGENIGMTKAAIGKEDATWDFLQWFLSLEVNVPYNTDQGIICPNLAATNQYPTNVVMQAFEEQVKYTVARGPHPKWPELSGALQDAIQETLTGTKTPARAGADAAAKIKVINDSIK
ncbi:ABC transporter substrate-binding protein [Spirochaetia bacterium]|nr:ABC transporter substrate-binding protein [Spirochaetia bacterium]